MILFSIYFLIESTLVNDNTYRMLSIFIILLNIINIVLIVKYNIVLNMI